MNHWCQYFFRSVVEKFTIFRNIVYIRYMKLNMKQKLDANPSHINPVLQPFYYSRKGGGNGEGGEGGEEGGGGGGGGEEKAI